MAYITTEQIAAIRKEIKAKFPAKENWKFSITKEHYSSVNVHILQAPVNFLAKYRNGQNVRPSKGDNAFLQQMYSIMNAGNHDNSDSMTDYFDVGWYANLYIGKWDKDFIFKA